MRVRDVRERETWRRERGRERERNINTPNRVPLHDPPQPGPDRSLVTAHMYGPLGTRTQVLQYGPRSA